MSRRYVKFFFGKEATEEYINYWVKETNNNIINIEVVQGEGHSTYFIVLYEHALNMKGL